MSDIDQQVHAAATQLMLARDAVEKAEFELRAWLCQKYHCAPGMRVIRTNTAQVRAKRPVWIVTKVIVDNIDIDHQWLTARPRIWARRLDHHNIPSSRYEKQLWRNWEPAP